MNINDIITLTNAGWTKDEILSIVNDQAQDPVQPTDPKPDPATQPEQPAAVQDDDRMSKLETKLDYAINRLNYMAVQGSQQPQQPQETVDDILASVVRGFKDDK